MKFTLDIDMSNAAFERYADDANVRDTMEVALILHALSKHLYSLSVLTEQSTGTLRDSNGNSVGSWDVTP